MLSEKQLEEARQALKALQAEIKAELEESAASREVVELDQTSVGRLSRMDAMQAQQLALATGCQRRQKLARCEVALQRIADGDYGICIICDDDIAPKRLALDPTVATCIGCASKNK